MMSTWTVRGHLAPAVTLLAVLAAVSGCGRAPAGTGTQVASTAAPTIIPVQTAARKWALDLPLRTWVSRPAPEPGQGPLPNGTGKHSRLLFDSKRGRMVLSGGDYTYREAGHDINRRSGMHIVWAIDLSKGEQATWTRLTSWCAAPGGVQPGRPDTVVWTYDSTRDQGVMMPGFYFITQKSTVTVCPGVDQTTDSVVFDFTSNTWSLPPYGPPPKGYGGDQGASYGVYDPVTDAVYRFRRMSANTMEILYRKTNEWEQVPLGASGSTLHRTNANRDQSAIDVEGRSIYAISWRMRALMRYSIPAKRVVDTIEMPPKWVPPIGPGDHETWAVFDPINRVVLIPVAQNFDGALIGLAIYHVDQKRWEWEDPPANGPEVSGNTVGFDPANNALILLGRNKAGLWWLYRYGEGTGNRGTSERRDRRPSSLAGFDVVPVSETTRVPAAPVRASRPAADAAAVARLEQMPDNSWLRLKPKSRTAYVPAVAAHDAAAPDLRERPVKTTDPIARSYSGLAIGDGLVFNFGGGHASHPGNEVDLYTVDANQWTVQYPPESPVNGSGEAKVIAGSGSSVAAITPLGRPYVEHTYQQSTYDSRRKRFLSVVASGTWSWDPATTKWTHLAGPALGTFSPGFYTGNGNVVYHAGADAFLAFVTAPRKGSERGVYRLNGDSATWSYVGAFPSRKEYSHKEIYSAYNPDRGEVAVVVGYTRLLRYRLEDKSWTEVPAFPKALHVGFPNFSYDSRHKVMVFLLTPRSGDDDGPDRQAQIWVWDPAADTWTNPPTAGTAPPPQHGKERASLVYDASRNVFVYLQVLGKYCREGGKYACGGATETWAYRYRR
ncbi:MAG TPA: hypothetical protein VLK35_22350 [Methylomirabilota bacterium]|nr:hypothetical protein [Methylomirabilota bacterium]